MSTLKNSHYERFAEVLKTRRHNLVEVMLAKLEDVQDDKAMQLYDRYSKNPTAVGDSQFADELVEASLPYCRDELDQLCAVQRAEHRIEEGQYGKCVRCKKEINLDTLSLIPTTAYCTNCMSKDN